MVPLAVTFMTQNHFIDHDKLTVAAQRWNEYNKSDDSIVKFKSFKLQKYENDDDEYE